MKELLLWTDIAIFILLGGIILLLLFRILPRTYRFFQEVKNGLEVSGFGYATDNSFWKWLLSKEGRIELYRDAKQQQTLYYNNFKFFNILWKLAVVLITFRILVFFFGPDEPRFKRGYDSIEVSYLYIENFSNIVEEA